MYACVYGYGYGSILNVSRNWPPPSKNLNISYKMQISSLSCAHWQQELVVVTPCRRSVSFPICPSPFYLCTAYSHPWAFAFQTPALILHLERQGPWESCQDPGRENARNDQALFVSEKAEDRLIALRTQCSCDGELSGSC
jgi:hypothetical protein